MFSSKLIYFICGIAIFGAVSDVALARPGKFDGDLNDIESEILPEDYKNALDENDGLIVAKADDGEIIELVDNDAVEEDDSDDVEIRHVAEIDDLDESSADGNEEEEKDDDILREEDDDEDEYKIVPEEDILGRRPEDKEDDDEIIEIEEEVLSEEKDDVDFSEAEAAWYEKVRQYFAKFATK